MGTAAKAKQRGVAVVAAGAGARGAYEAGALSVLLPWLDEQGLRPSIFVGTSAGAINAGLLAATADLPAAESAQTLVDFWSELRVQDVFRAPLLSGPGTALRFLAQLTGLPGSRITSLLDNAPLTAFAKSVFEPYAENLRANISSGAVRALAVAATDARDRTTMFCELADGVALPTSSSGRAIDYATATIDERHIRASAAIPVLFEPVEVDGGWYVDGGVRLNAPLSPAVNLAPTHVVVVATHPANYDLAKPAEPGPEPDVIDSAAALLSGALADRMVEDLITLDKLNRIAAKTPSTEVLLIPRLFVGPATRNQLGQLATKHFPDREHGGLDALGVIHRLLGSSQPGSGEILSYVFFDPTFANAAIDQGRADAAAQLALSDPWAP